MTGMERLWLNGFTTASEMLANDSLAIEEVRDAFEEEDRVSTHQWLAPWMEGLDAGVRASYGI